MLSATRDKLLSTLLNVSPVIVPFSHSRGARIRFSIIVPSRRAWSSAISLISMDVSGSLWMRCATPSRLRVIFGKSGV
jgi:hypothetical protein